jgi:hypothetical protein
VGISLFDEVGNRYSAEEVAVEVEQEAVNSWKHIDKLTGFLEHEKLSFTPCKKVQDN